MRTKTVLTNDDVKKIAVLGRRESKFYEALIKQGRTAFLSAAMTGFLKGGVPIVAACEVIGSISVSV